MSETVAPPFEASGPMARLGDRLGISEGRAYTLVIGLVVALVAAYAGIPPTLRDAAAPSLPRPPTELFDEPGGDELAGSTRPGDEVAAPLPVDDTSGSFFEPPADAAFEPAASPGAPIEGSADPTPATPPAAPSFGPLDVFTTLADPGAPSGVAVMTTGGVVVGTDNVAGRGRDTAPQAIVIGPDGSVLRRHQISGDGGIVGLAGSGNAVVVLRTTPPHLLRLDPTTGATTELATLPDLPPCAVVVFGGPCSTTPTDAPPRPTGLTIDRTGALFVSDGAQATLWRLGAGGRSPEVFHQAPDYVGERGLSGVSVAPDGSLVLTVEDGVRQATSGSVLRLSRTAQGAPGELTVLATTDREARPSGVAVDRAGQIHATLAGTDRLLVLGADGAELGQLMGDLDQPCSSPRGVAAGAAAVFVTCLSPGEPDGAKVVRIEVDRVLGS